MHLISYTEFEKVDIRVGTIIEIRDFPEARKPTFQLFIDFGSEIGVKRSSSQITQHYRKESLLGKQVIAVINFPEKQVGPFVSQVLTLGLADEAKGIVLVSPDLKVPNGERLL